MTYCADSVQLFLSVITYRSAFALIEKKPVHHGKPGNNGSRLFATRHGFAVKSTVVKAIAFTVKSIAARKWILDCFLNHDSINKKTG